MTANILTSLLFYGGYMGMRTHWQARLFLLIGAGYQWLIYAMADPRPPELWVETIIISLASGLGYVAWRSANRWPEDGLLSRRRLAIFAGFALNWALAVWLLNLSGQI
ncbi:hypothetical protein OO012_02880 [Rhodobacteraceae bacterium KMM 6894]|nr:hypothetical protein [Rhodobacteraceae bacterium KMM 6894]